MQKHQTAEGVNEMPGANATATSLPGAKALNVELVVGGKYQFKSGDKDIGDPCFTVEEGNMLMGDVVGNI
jgi:hypothetical protein